MRWRTRCAVSPRVCQIGCNVPSTSALVISETGSAPRRGKAWVLVLGGEFWITYRM